MNSFLSLRLCLRVQAASRQPQLKRISWSPRFCKRHEHSREGVGLLQQISTGGKKRFRVIAGAYGGRMGCLVVKKKEEGPIGLVNGTNTCVR